jgi:ketosteroid isomerase-like protein
MSGSNAQAVHRLIDAIAARDLAAMRELTDPDVEWRSFFAISAGGVYRGHAALVDYLRDVEEAFESLRPSVDSLLEIGDLIVAVGHIHFRGSGSGVETDVLAGWLLKFRNGKVLMFRAFPDPEQTLERVGLGD